MVFRAQRKIFHSLSCFGDTLQIGWEDWKGKCLDVWDGFQPAFALWLGNSAKAGLLKPPFLPPFVKKEIMKEPLTSCVEASIIFTAGLWSACGWLLIIVCIYQREKIIKKALFANVWEANGNDTFPWTSRPCLLAVKVFNRVIMSKCIMEHILLSKLDFIIGKLCLTSGQFEVTYHINLPIGP